MIHFTRMGAATVFAIEAFGTRVAMPTQDAHPPAFLLAEHLEGERPVLVYRVADLERSIGEVEARGLEIAVRFGIPHGPGAELTHPGPQRIALYELTRPAAAEKLAGRRDF